MRGVLLIASLGCAACEGAGPDEVSFLETRYVRYVSDQPFAPCGGLARETDKRVEYLFDLLSEPYATPLSISYDWAESSSELKCNENVAGCAEATPDGASISSLYLADFHELAHATHLLTVGTSHRLLTEGFASYASNQPRVIAPQDAVSFTQAIERIIGAGAPSADEYPLAARFVGTVIERHGISAFKDFWRKVPRDVQLTEFRATYEASFGESWSDALAVVAAHEQTAFRDLLCEGNAEAVGDQLQRTFTQTCQDDAVTGPLRNSGIVTGELPVPLELASEGMYRFRFGNSGEPRPVAAFRGCSNGAPAPVPAITLFSSNDDVTQYLGPGRYLLIVRVPLTPSDSSAVEVTIERTQ